MTPVFMPQTKMQRKVSGLREYATPGAVRVYQAQPNGAKGKLLRIEGNDGFSPKFNSRYQYRKQR